MGITIGVDVWEGTGPPGSTPQHMKQRWLAFGIGALLGALFL